MADGNVLELTSDNFDSIVGGDQPTLVDFWAEWCGPCRMIAPSINELADEFEGRARVGKVDIDAEPMLADRFRVRSIPTLLFFGAGDAKNPAGQVIGVQRKEALAARLGSLIDA